MDLRSIANSASTVVNPNTTVSVQASTGTTMGAGLRQVPSYAAAVSGPAQIQALNKSELKHIDNLNIQGYLLAIYLRGPLAAVVRPNSQGGDLVTIVNSGGSVAVIAGQTYLIATVLEAWPNWTKAVMVLQNATAQ